MPTHQREHTSPMNAKGESLVLPNDEHNRTLVDNVHPSNWVNPEAPAATTSWSSGLERRD